MSTITYESGSTMPVGGATAIIYIDPVRALRTLELRAAIVRAKGAA